MFGKDTIGKRVVTAGLWGLAALFLMTLFLFAFSFGAQTSALSGYAAVSTTAMNTVQVTSSSSSSGLLESDGANGYIYSFTKTATNDINGQRHGTFPYLYNDATDGWKTASKSFALGSMLIPAATDEAEPQNYIWYYDTQDCLLMKGSILNDSADNGLVFTFPLGDEFKKALKDQMLTVTVTPYIIMYYDEDTIADSMSNDKADMANIELSFYDQTNNIARRLTDKGVTLSLEKKFIAGKTSGRLSSVQCGDNCFLQVRLHNFQTIGSSFGMAFTEVGVRVAVTPNTSLSIAMTKAGTPSSNPNDIGKTTTCIVEGVDRNTIAPSNAAKRGDNLAVNLILQMGGNDLVIDTAPAGGGLPGLADCKDGTMFRHLFLDPELDTFLITWTIQEGQLMDEMGEGTQDSNNISVTSGNYSGQQVSFTVYDGDIESGNLVLIPTISYRMNKGLSNSYLQPLRTTLAVTVEVDKYAPNTPELDPNNLFYASYISEDTWGYYTKVTEESELDSSGEVLRFAVTGGSNASRPTFTESAMDLAGGTSLIVYYRSYYVADERPRMLSEQNALGFVAPIYVNTATSGQAVYEAYENHLDADETYYKLLPISEREEAAYAVGNPTAGLNLYERNNVGKYVKSGDSVILGTKEYYVPQVYAFESAGEFGGVYFTKTGDEEDDIQYQSIYVNMKCTENGAQKIRKSGVWAVEFYAYDLTGNKQLSAFRYFLNIDITEYEFTINYTVESSASEGRINTDNFTVSAAVYDADGKLGTYTDGGGSSLFFRRSDVVMVKVFFRSSDAFTRYMLTDFKAGNISFTATGFRPVSNAEYTLGYYDNTFVSGRTGKYSFTVESAFCDNPDLRKLTFAFKTRVNINTGMTEQIYDGTGKSIVVASVTPVLAGSTVNGQVKNSVKVEYFTDSTLEEPVSVGTQGQNQPVDVGTYYFKAELISHSMFYGITIGTLRINKKTPVINPINPNISISYGDSLLTLDSVRYDEETDSFVYLRDEDGHQIAGSGINVVVNVNNRDYFLSTMSLPDANGRYVPGYYVIDAENKKASSFVKPNAGTVTIRVKFIPVKGTISNDANGVPKANFEYDENFDFIPDGNYSVVYNTVDITVVHDDRVSFNLAPAQEAGAGNIRTTTMLTNAGATRAVRYVEYTYNGKERTVDFSIKSEYETIANGDLVDLYDYAVLAYAPAESLTLTEVQIGNLRYNASKPTAAGYYAVRVTLNESKCNYTATVYTYINIKKIKLAVKVDTRTTYTYQYENLPDIDATLNDVSYNQEIAGFSYRYYYYDPGMTNEELLSDENLVAAKDLREYSGNPIPVGQYFLVVDVTDPNYEGSGSGVYTIGMVQTDNARLNAAWPIVNGSALDAQYDIFEGQPLAEINVSLSYTFTYTYRVFRSATSVTGTNRTLTGTPFIATMKYDEWLAENGGVDSQESRAAYMNEMLFYEPAYSVQTYSYFLCYAVRNTVGATTFDMNFDFLYKQEYVRVGLPYADWTQVRIDPITYNGAVDWSEVSLNDAEREDSWTVSETLGYLYSVNALTTGLAEGTYYVVNDSFVYRYADAESYAFALADAQPVVTTAGNAVVSLVAIGTNPELYTFYGTANLTIRKRPVEIGYSGGVASGTYRAYDEASTKSALRYYTDNGAGGRDELDGGELGFVGSFRYYRYDEDAPDHCGAVVEYADLVSGRYVIEFTLNNVNYEGVGYGEFVMNPSALTLVDHPYVDEQYVTYGAVISENTVFLPGTFVGEGGENVSGRYVPADRYGVVNVATVTLRGLTEASVFPDAGTDVELCYVFVPDDNANYLSYDSIAHEMTGKNRFGVRVTVGKADVSAQLRISLNAIHEEYNYRYKEIRERDIPGIVTFTHEGETDFAYELSVTDSRGLEIGMTSDRYLNAGAFTVTLTILDDNNAGSVSATLEVGKKKAYLPLHLIAERGETNGVWFERDGVFGEKKQYNGGTQGLDYTVMEKEDGEMVAITESPVITYYLNGIALSGAPSAIGLYEVRMGLSASMNYTLADEETDEEIEYLTAFLMLSVKLSTMEIVNLEQTFNMPAIVTVFMGGNDVDDDEYEIVFRQGETLYTDLPVAAGRYEVLLVFDPYKLNGYDETVLGTDIDPGYVLVINRLHTEITVSNEIVTTYTGTPGEKFFPYTSPYDMSMLYTYRRKGSGGEFTEIAPAALGALDAGEYDVRLSITDNNYRGEKTITYIVNKARLTEKSAPVFAPYQYNSPDAPEYVGGGRFTFGGVEQAGTFSIAVSKISGYAVGEYASVTYTFTPDSGNFSSATGTTALSVVKRVLPDDFVAFGEDGDLLLTSDHSVEFNETVRSLHVSFDYGKIYNYPAENGDFSVSVKYSRVEDPLAYTFSPSEIGSYVVTAQVSSKNYSYLRTWAYRLIITQGTPIITQAPAVNERYAIDYVFGESDLSGGRAQVNGTDSEVPGSFRCDDVTLDHANDFSVTVTFVPSDTVNFRTVTFPLTVRVVGRDPLKIDGVVPAEGNTASGTNWTGAVLTPAFTAKTATLAPLGGSGAKTPVGNTNEHGVVPVITAASGATRMEYGALLSAFRLTVQCNHENCSQCRAAMDMMLNNGAFVFDESADTVPDVGSSLRVAYRVRVELVENADRYNTMIGTVDVGDLLVKKKLTATNSTFNVLKFGDGADDYILTIYNQGALIVGVDRSDGTRLYGKIADTDTTETVSVAISDVTEETLRLTFSSRNYEATAVVVAYETYTRLAEGAITASRTFKTYDGTGITASDLGIVVHGTALSVPASAVTVTVYDDEGKESAGIKKGTYRVTAYVSDAVNRVYGTRTFTFEVRARDVSNEIGLFKSMRAEGGAAVYYDSYNSGSHTKLIPELNGEEIPSGEYRIAIKEKGLSDHAYGAVMTLNAGEYDVRVIVYGEDIVGTAYFSYTVDPQPVYATGTTTVYTVTYAGADWQNFNITPSFADADNNFFSLDDRGGYSVYYYASNYPKQTGKPTNAGTYTVSVEANNANYRVFYGTYVLVITPKPVRIQTAPEAVATDLDGNHLVYGQTLASLSLRTTDALVVDTQKGTAVAGTFAVAPSDIDRVLFAGNRTVTVTFTPDDVNYAVVTCDLAVKVGKQPLKLEFESLSAAYTGSSRKNELRYKALSADVTITFTFTNKTGQIVDPVTAGVYTFSAAISDSNYSVDLSNAYSGNAPTFTVRRASVNTVVKPTASGVGVGESLNKSAISGGQVYYLGFADPIKGTFSFVEGGRAFGTAGEKTVEVLFTPDDNTNFASYRTTITVSVGRGTATVTPGTNVFTYGEPAVLDPTRLSFTTLPADLNASIVCDFTCNGKTYRSGEILPAGTYWFTCRIDDGNYTSEEVLFSYVVKKKEIDVDFVKADGSVVTSYTVKYGKEADVGVQLYDPNNNMNKRYYLLRDAETMYDLIEYKYVSRGDTKEYSGENPPDAIGSYDLTVTIRHDNYEATRTIIYRVTTGTVESIDFEVESLIHQVYGAVSAPIVSTTPAGVGYYVIYQGYDREVPTAVGSYNITVYILDDNYESMQKSAVFKVNPKPLTVTNIHVEDKVYDGVSTLKISATPEGVLYGDEVYLTIAARTFNGETGVGDHYVEITECRITGLNAENYTLTVPAYDGMVRIYNNTVTATTGTSYIISAQGFASGTGLTVNELDTERNKTSVWSKMVGVESTVLEYSIKVNDVSEIVDGQYKICVEIPEQYRNKKFNVEFTGELAGHPVSYSREGNFIAFYASTTSGEVVFSAAEFKYGYVVTAAVLAIILIALVVFLILNPMRHRRSVTDPQATKNAVKRIKAEKRGK